MIAIYVLPHPGIILTIALKDLRDAILAIGAGIEMLFGLLLGNMAMGIGAGVVVGLLVGSVVQTQGSAKGKES